MQKSQVGGCSALSDTLCNSGMDPRAIFLNVIFFSGEEVNAFLPHHEWGAHRCAEGVV